MDESIWAKRRASLLHDYAIAAMYFDPTPEILVRAKASSAEEDAALDRIATKLLKAKGIDDDDIPARLATLEVELKDFWNRTGPFDANSKIWHSSLLAEGRGN